MDFQQFENEVAVPIPPDNGEPFVFVKSKPADLSPSMKKRFLILGTLQIINGLLLIIFNITAIFVRSEFTMYIGPGIWVGICAVVSGTFGVLIHSKTSRGYVVTFMVLSIISSVIVCFVIGMAIPGIGFDYYHYNYVRNNIDYHNNYDYHNIEDYDYNNTNYNYADSYYHHSPLVAQIAINSVLLIIGVVEMVIAIVASAFGCGVMWCNSEPTTYIPVRMDMHTNKLVFENTSPPAFVSNQQY